jgi:hypothetical protein
MHTLQGLGNIPKYGKDRRYLPNSIEAMSRSVLVGILGISREFSLGIFHELCLYCKFYA